MRPRKLTPLKLNQYLEHLAAGVRRTAAAKAIGVDRSAIILYIQQHPEFGVLRDEAEMSANELVESALFNTALKGNVTAQQVWLYNRDPDRWADKRSTKIEVSQPANLDEVRAKIEAAIAKAP